MNSPHRNILIAALLLGFTSVAASDGPSKKWKLFRSATGFSVMYPAGWYPIGISKDRLDIRSSKGGAKGVVIKRGQARIVTIEAESSPKATLAQIIEDYEKGGSTLSRKSIHNETAGERACGDLEMIVSKEPLIPPEDAALPVPYMVDAVFFCEADEHKFITHVRNYDGDPHQEEYQRIGLRVAESLRLAKQN